MPTMIECPIRGEACGSCDRQEACEAEKQEAKRNPMVRVAKLAEEIGLLGARINRARNLSEAFGPQDVKQMKKLRELLVVKMSEMERMLRGWSKEAGRVKATLHGSGYGQSAPEWEMLERHLAAVGVQLGDLSDMAHAAELPLD